MNKPFAERIALMNEMYRLPKHSVPTIPADVVDRLGKFKITLRDEVDEIDEIIEAARNGASATDLAVAIADVLGDIIVYQVMFEQCLNHIPAAVNLDVGAF